MNFLWASVFYLFFQMGLGFPGPFVPQVTGGTSNLTYVQSGTCANTSGGASYTCSGSVGNWCRTPGNLLLVEESWHGSSTGTPGLPTDGGDTFVQDKTVTAASGRITFFSFVNCQTSRATITMNPAASRISDATVSEFSGAAISAAFDSAASATVSNGGGNGVWWSYEGATASNLNDLGVAAAFDNSGRVNYLAGAGWTLFPPCASSPYCGNGTDGDGAVYQYFVNGQGQFGPNGTRPSSSTIFGAYALYKSAVGGTASGFYPSLLINWSGGTNGSSVALADLATSTHGGQVYNNGANAWSCSVTCTGATYTTTNEIPLTTKVTAQGVVYPAASPTYSMTYNPSVLGTNSGPKYSFLAPASSYKATACGFNWYDADQVNGNSTNWWTFVGVDRASPIYGNDGAGNDWVKLETAEGDSSTLNIAGKNRLYYTCVLFDGTQNGTHSLTEYDCGPIASPTACSLVGTVTHAGSTSTNSSPAYFVFGHVSGGNPNINFYYGPWQIDFVNAVSPLGP